LQDIGAAAGAILAGAGRHAAIALDAAPPHPKRGHADLPRGGNLRVDLQPVPAPQ
jgi:hypothetical protein